MENCGESCFWRRPVGLDREAPDLSRELVLHQPVWLDVRGIRAVAAEAPLCGRSVVLAAGGIHGGYGAPELCRERVREQGLWPPDLQHSDQASRLHPRTLAHRDDALA